jgi:Lrp/AsnC family leucine-responsive transcriptional regulator
VAIGARAPVPLESAQVAIDERQKPPENRAAAFAAALSVCVVARTSPRVWACRQEKNHERSSDEADRVHGRFLKDADDAEPSVGPHRRRKRCVSLAKPAQFANNPAMALDAHDRKLLRALQVNANQTHTELARRVHLSPSSVRRRLAVLRRNRTIRGEVALLDPAVLSDGILVLVLLSFKKETPRIHNDFERRIRTDSAVLQCHRISGEFDFALFVRAAEPSDYDQWGRRVLLPEANLARYSSFVVWSTMKHSPQPLITLTEPSPPIHRKAHAGRDSG